jgi:hypothetical protein
LKTLLEDCQPLLPPHAEQRGVVRGGGPLHSVEVVQLTAIPVGDAETGAFKHRLYLELQAHIEAVEVVAAERDHVLSCVARTDPPARYEQRLPCTHLTLEALVNEVPEEFVLWTTRPLARAPLLVFLDVVG